MTWCLKLLLIASLSPKSLVNLKGMIILNLKHTKVEQKWHVVKFHFEIFNLIFYGSSCFYCWVLIFRVHLSTTYLMTKAMFLLHNTTIIHIILNDYSIKMLLDSISFNKYSFFFFVLYHHNKHFI